MSWPLLASRHLLVLHLLIVAAATAAGLCVLLFFVSHWLVALGSPWEAPGREAPVAAASCFCLMLAPFIYLVDAYVWKTCCVNVSLPNWFNKLETQGVKHIMNFINVSNDVSC